MEIKDFEWFCAMLEKAGDKHGAAKHRRTLPDKQKEAADALYVAPLSQRATSAHKQMQDLTEKLANVAGHFDRL
eukprot:8381513-Pyramimonas_sp.AAC.1